MMPCGHVRGGRHLQGFNTCNIIYQGLKLVSKQGLKPQTREVTNYIKAHGRSCEQHTVLDETLSHLYLQGCLTHEKGA
jgi:hypothetical protein